MVVFALGSDSGFQIGADGILDDYDDEGGISVVLWCIIFVFLLVVTIWFYISQLVPRNVKCVDDEDVEDEEERVANKLLNQLGTGKCDSKNSPREKESDVSRPSTSREISNDYEVIDGEIRIHHSSYEWENERRCDSKGNAISVREMSETLVRRPSMEEMSLIFPGVLFSITEEEEEEKNDIQENDYKEEDRDVCEIRDLEGDSVKSFANISPDSNIYKASADVYSSLNDKDDKNIDQIEEYRTLVHGKDNSGRQITNRKGKQPAKNYKTTAEIRLRSKISEVPAVVSDNNKSRPDKTIQVCGPAGCGVKASNVTDNPVSVLQLGKTPYSSQNMNSLIPISGSKTREFDPKDQNHDINTRGDCIKRHEGTTSANRKDVKAAKDSSIFGRDAKMFPISAPLNSDCYVNKKSNENIICIETSDANLQSEPDKSLDNLEETNNANNKPSPGSIIPKEIDLPLSNGLKNSTFKGPNSMSNHLKHAWTFYSMSESNNNELNDINGDHKDISSIKIQDQSQEIPTIVVDNYEEEKDASIIEKYIWTRSVGQIDSFETDIDVDDVDLEEEYEYDSDGGEFNMFLKRHVSVTDLDKVLSSNENIQDENYSEAENFESEQKENNLETIEGGLNIVSANRPVYTESSLDDIWGDYDCAKNGTLTQNVKHLTEISEETSKTCSSENVRYDLSRVELKSEFFSRQSVWTTLDQITDNAEEKNDASDSLVESPIENKKKKYVDVTVSSENNVKVDENLDRKMKHAVLGEKYPKKIDKHALVHCPEKNMPELKKGSEEECISSTPIIVNEFNVISVLADSCKHVNKSGFDNEDKSNKTVEVEDVNRFVDGEVTLETITSTCKDYSKNNRNIVAVEPVNPGECSRSDVDSDNGVIMKGAKREGAVRDYSRTAVEGNTELRQTIVLEKDVPQDMNSSGVVAENSTKMLRQQDIVLDGRKENGDRVKRDEEEHDSNHIDLITPACTRRREDVIYGRRKTKNDGSGKRADFILRLNETSRNREKMTSPSNHSESDDNDGLERDVTQITQSSQVVESSSSTTLEANDKSSSYLNSTTQEIHDKVTQEETKLCTLNVTQSSDTIEPEVNEPLESEQESLGEMEADAGETVKCNNSEEILTNEIKDSNGNYRIERRDVQPKFEKSIVLNPVKKELQTLIKIDHIPDTHIGLEICMTGRFDVEQNRPTTGLEKAEQIVANRLKRIEAEKKATEQKKYLENVENEVHKETRHRKDYISRKPNYDETRYRRSHRGTPVDERVTSQESSCRKIQWNDFKLDDIGLDEIDVPDTNLPINDASDDFDLQGYREKTTNKNSSEKMVEEIVGSETFAPREIDWSLLELSYDEEYKKTKPKVVGSHLDSKVDKYQEIKSLETDEKNEVSTEYIALQKANTRSSHKEIPLRNSSIKMESSRSREEKELESKPKQYHKDKQLDLDPMRKKRSDVLKKKICDELSNMDLENTAVRMSSPTAEPQYPVRLTKSFSELRSIDKDNSDSGTFRQSDRSSDPPSPQDPGVAPSSEDEAFSESPKRVFKTRVTVDEVRGNKRRITIINIRKKSSGSTRCKSLNDIDSASTQKQIFKFTSISSLSGDEKTLAEQQNSSAQNSKNGEEMFVVSDLSPKEELDSASKSDETRPIISTASLQVNKEVPLMGNIAEVDPKLPENRSLAGTHRGGMNMTSSRASQEGYRRHVRCAEETIISSTRDIPPTGISYMENKDTEGRTISSKETVLVANSQSPTHSSDTGYHSKEENPAVQRTSSLSPVTVQASRRSPTGTVFALSRHSPTPLSDSEKKHQEKCKVQRQSSLSPETVQSSRRSPTGTIFALSRHSPTPFSDSEKRRDGKSKDDVKTVHGQTFVEKKARTTERSSRYGTSQKGTFFAVSKYSPTTSDSENQGKISTKRSHTEVQPKYQSNGLSTRGTTVPIRSSSKKQLAEYEDKDKDKSNAPVFEEKFSKDVSNLTIQDKHEQEKVQHETGKRPKIREKVKESRIEESKSAPERIVKETTFTVSEREPKTSAKQEMLRQNESSSSGSTLTKQTSPDDQERKESLTLLSNSEGEYMITTDGWLEKIPGSLSPPNSDDERTKIVKETDLDSLLTGVTSSSTHVTQEKSVTLEKRQSTSVVSSIHDYNRNASSSRNVLLSTYTELEKSPHTRITSTGVPETDLDALFGDEVVKDITSVQNEEEKEMIEGRTSLLRKTVVNRNGKILVTEEKYKTRKELQPVEAVAVTVREPVKSKEAQVIQAISLSESPGFGDLDDDVFNRFPGRPGIDHNGYRADGTYSSDADSETSSLNSVHLKSKTRHTRSSLEAAKYTVRAPRSPLSSDSSSAPTPIPLERRDVEYDPFHHILSSRNTTDRNKKDYPRKSFVASRKATKESGHYVNRITAEGNGFLIDSSDGASQRISRAYSENQVDTTEFRRSAFTPVRHLEKEMRSSSQENILSRIPAEQESTRYNDIDPELNTESTFIDMANSHKSMPDLHKPPSESDAQLHKVPYHSRLSAHTRLWLSQTAGIDTSNLCQGDTVGSEIFLFPSNRFQPGKSVDESFLTIASDTDDIHDDVSTRPSSPMSEFSFAGEAPFGGDFQGDVIVVTCGNAYCGKDEIVRSHDKTSFTSCPSCFTYYCSNECRRAHWREHKKVCYFGRINSYMRSFVYFCHKKENLKLLLSKIATRNFSSKGLGCVMVTFASPKQARKFMTSGCVLLPSPPSYSTVRDLQQEGVVSKHKVNLIQQVKDHDPNHEFVLNLAIVAGKLDDLPIYPVPRHKLNTVLECIRIPLCESLVQRPKTVIPDTNKETKVFYLPKCSRHEFVNDMEARRHYCRIISKSLKEYGIKMKKDYPEAYDNLCLYVEKNVQFQPLTVYGNKDSKIIACKIMPEGYTSTTLI